MCISIYISMLLSLQGMSTYVDRDLIAQRGFDSNIKVSEESTSDWDSVSARFRNPREKALLSVEVTRCKSEPSKTRLLNNINSLLSVGTVSDWPSGGPSGLPGGDSSYFSVGDEGLHYYIWLGKYCVSAVLTYSGSGNRGSISWSGSDKVGDRLAVEGFCRDALATAVGATLQDAGNVTVNGRVISGVRRDSGGAVFVPLSAWCAARGIPLNMIRPHGTASFGYRGHSFVVPLAADKVKVDNRWVSLGGFVMRAAERWYAPLGGLENAIR
jgi:hypothetical protein